MKVKIIPDKRELTGDFYSGDILDDKEYEVVKVHDDVPLYNIVDESGEEFTYPIDMKKRSFGSAFLCSKIGGEEMPNAKNLISNSERTPKELKEQTSKGGRASGEARRAKKQFQEAVLAILETPDAEGTVLERIVAAQVERALKGDTRAFEVLRDTSGEKPTDKVEASVTDEKTQLMREYLESLKK